MRVASIPGRVFAFISVRRTTSSCSPNRYKSEMSKLIHLYIADEQANIHLYIADEQACTPLAQHTYIGCGSNYRSACTVDYYYYYSRL